LKWLLLAARRNRRGPEQLVQRQFRIAQTKNRHHRLNFYRWRDALQENFTPGHNMKNTISRTLLLAFSALLYGAQANDSYAQAAKTAVYPDKPVRLLIASAAGGGTDIIARLLGSKLTTIWGQQVVGDNRPGGGGVIATDILTKAAPDG
jgi:hypothetical protein